MHDKLTEENFLLYCASHYGANVPYASTEDFLEDLNRIKYIKKLITRYVENGELRERLILNHIIVLNNCFGPDALVRILYLKLHMHMRYIKPFLVLLQVLPEKIHNVGDEETVDTDLIEMDSEIVARLRKV